MLHTLTAQFSTIIYIAVVGFALLRGGPAERWAALVVGLDAIVYVIAFDRRNYWDPQMRLVLIEGAELIGLAVVTFRYPKRWLFAATGAQLLCVLMRVIPLLDPRIKERAWLTLEVILGYVVLLCLVWGAVQAMRARRKARDAAPAS